MGWKLTATFAVDEVVYKETYGTHTGLENPIWAHGFVSGFAHARGLSPGDVLFEYEKTGE